MKCFVTGASGFIGSNLVHELLRRGHEVRALVRPRADTRGLNGAGCERVSGDVLDPAALEPAMRGCDWCFHAAAQYALWVRDSLSMYAANVEGTRNVLQAATRAGCRRIVYTSTVGCIGLPHANGEEIRPSDETVAATPGEMTCHYKRSKWQAESVAAELAAQGAPIVIVNPSAPLGPRDAKPTPTGKVVLDFLNRRLPAYVDTGLNWVHVRDVAVGHILAAERGRLGERYILGNANGNWTMHETLLALEEITGLAAPRLRMPYLAALAAAYVDEARARVTGAPPMAVLAGVRMAKDKMYYSPAKAIRELGLPQTPPRIGMVEAVEWFRSNGYVTG